MYKTKYSFRKQFPWAINALKRDNYKCVECGSENYVIVHHKDQSRKLGKQMNNALDNLSTLCKPCHAEAHHQTMRFTNPNLDLIKEMYNQGKTYEFIGKHLGISRQRVHQIVKISKSIRPSSRPSSSSSNTP